MTRSAKVFVTDLTVEAEIGLWTEEKGRRQRLGIEVELDISGQSWRHLAETVNYESVLHHARAIAAGGHIGLVETFAQRLADACLAEPQVTRARVRVTKPGALAPHALAAVEITATRDPGGVSKSSV